MSSPIGRSEDITLLLAKILLKFEQGICEGELTSDNNSRVDMSVHYAKINNWASEASPTLGRSIENSRDIYIYRGMSVVCQINCVGGITWNKHAHAQSQVLGG